MSGRISYLHILFSIVLFFYYTLGFAFEFGTVSRDHYERVVLSKYKSFAKQVKKENTVYVIRDNFNLRGEIVCVPKDCVLQFEGGSVYNGLIVGDKMPTDMIYTPEMFGADRTGDDTKAIQSALNVCRNVSLGGSYNVYANEANTDNASLMVPSNTIISIDGSITYLTNTLDKYLVFLIDKASNISISGKGRITGDKNIHKGAAGEWGHGIGLYRSKNVSISGIELSNFWGDGIYMYYGTPVCENVSISNIHIHDFRRQGISITGGKDIHIEDFKIENIRGTNPQSAIDIENHSAFPIDDVIINKGVILNCCQGVIIQNKPSKNVVANSNYTAGDRINNIKISNVKSKEAVCLLTHNVSFEECDAIVGVAGPCEISNSTIDVIETANSERLDGYCTINNSKVHGLVNQQNSQDIQVLFENCVLQFESQSGNGIFRNANGSPFLFYDCKIYFKKAIETPYVVSNSEFHQCLIDCYDTPYIRGKIYDSEIVARLQGKDTRVFINRGGTMIYDSQIKIIGDRNIPLYYIEAGAGRADLVIENSTISDVMKNRTKVVDKSSGQFSIKEKKNKYIDVKK